MNLILFIIGTAAHTFIKYLDHRETTINTALGMGEQFALVATNGVYNPVKAWILIGIITAISAGLFFIPEPSESWHPLYALGVYTISGIGSLILVFHNRKKRRNRLEREKRMAGGIV